MLVAIIIAHLPARPVEKSSSAKTVSQHPYKHFAVSGIGSRRSQPVTTQSLAECCWPVL